MTQEVMAAKRQTATMEQKATLMKL